MEAANQPSTIGEMSPQHFQTFIIAIIKQVTDPRFKEIDQRFEVIDQHFEAIDRRFDAIDERFDILETAVGQVIDDVETLKTTTANIEANVGKIKDTQYLHESRFGMIEGYIVRHDRILEKQAA